MEVHQLRYFLAVARFGHFSRAAEYCRVAQPSLSQQIMKLEDELGEKLFHRAHRDISLTGAGELFRERAKRVLAELELARDEIGALSGTVSGRVALGVIPTVAPYFLPSVLVDFSKQYPEVEVEVAEQTTAGLLTAVRERELDLALLSVPVVAKGVVVETLFEEPLWVALPAGHALAQLAELRLTDLDAEKFILMQDGHCLAGQALQFCAMKGFAPQVAIRSAQMETVLAFVAAGLGISLVPRMACEGRTKLGIELRPLVGEGGGPTRAIGLVRRDADVATQPAVALASFIRAHVSSGASGLED